MSSNARSRKARPDKQAPEFVAVERFREMRGIVEIVERALRGKLAHPGVLGGKQRARTRSLDVGEAARPQDSEDLLRELRTVIHVLDHMAAKDAVNASFGKRQRTLGEVACDAPYPPGLQQRLGYERFPVDRGIFVLLDSHQRQARVHGGDEGEALGHVAATDVDDDAGGNAAGQPLARRARQPKPKGLRIERKDRHGATPSW